MLLRVALLLGDGLAIDANCSMKSDVTVWFLSAAPDTLVIFECVTVSVRALFCALFCG
jgi:hypothetical protein